MNASNLMAVSAADGISAGGGAQKVRSVSAGNRAQLTSGKNLFSDTFGALQKGMDAGTSKTEMRNAPANAPQMNVSQAESAAPSQDTQDVTAEMPKTVSEQQTAPAAEKKMPSVDDPAEQAAAVAALAALVNTDLNGDLDAALTEILERYGLTSDQRGDAQLQSDVQNLLQQLPEEGAKSRNLLLALAGEPLTQQNGLADLTAAVQEAETAQSAPADAQVLRLAALSAQLRAELGATDGQVPEGQQSTSAAESALPRIPMHTAPSAASENAQTMMEKVAAPLLRAQTDSLSAAQLVGENLIVDEETTATSPLAVLAQRTLRHDTTQGDASGQQSAQGEQRDASSPLPVRTAEMSASSTQSGTQQNFAAAFETAQRTTEHAPQPAQPIAAQTGTGLAPAQEVISPAPAQEAQRPQPDYEIPRQIVEQARLLRTLNDTQMIIRLKPEHLGELTLRVAVGSDGAVQASFHSDNAHVRNVIENSLVQLRQELSNQGIKVDRVGVYTGLADGQMPQGQGQEAWQQSGSHHAETRVYARGDADDYLDEVDGIAQSAVQEIGGSVGADGVDYRV